MAADFLEKMKVTGGPYSSVRERRGRGEGLRRCWAVRLGLGRPKQKGRGKGSVGEEVGYACWAVSRPAHCGEGGKGGGEVSTGWAAVVGRAPAHTGKKGKRGDGLSLGYNGEEGGNEPESAFLFINSPSFSQ